jgi:hypothetical protein
MESCAISSPHARIAPLAVVIATSNITAGAGQHRNGQKAELRFLATGTLIRGTWGANEDSYLAQLTFAHEDNLLLVGLVDSCPNEAPPSPRAVLTSLSGKTFKMRRNMACDLPDRRMILRTARGAPMAILHEGLGYQPQLIEAPEPSHVVPCYETSRHLQ